jgi:hypothetical protein
MGKNEQALGLAALGISFAIPVESLAKGVCIFRIIIKKEI